MSTASAPKAECKLGVRRTRRRIGWTTVGPVTINIAPSSSAIDHDMPTVKCASTAVVPQLTIAPRVSNPHTARGAFFNSWRSR
jgi:hypothetical protein